LSVLCAIGSFSVLRLGITQADLLASPLNSSNIATACLDNGTSPEISPIEDASSL
jgi:hypothetical protein